MKRLGVWVVVVVVGLFAWTVYRRMAEAKETGKKGKRGPAAVAVQVAGVTRADMRDTATFSASLRSDAEFVAAPKTGGRLERLLVNLGDTVTNGQVIALLDDLELVQEVEQARAALQVAKAAEQEAGSAADVAKQEFDRVEELRRKEIVSKSEYESAKAQHEVQEARRRLAAATVSQREAAMRAAEVRLSYARLTASWEGGAPTRVVGERFVTEGAMMRANEPVVSLVELHPLTAVLFVGERDYGRLQTGQVVTVVSDALAGREFAGTVARVAPRLKESSRQAQVEVAVPNPEGVLKPGMFARVRVEFARRDGVQAVPDAAVTRRGDRSGVFEANLADKNVKFVPVRTGIRSGGLVEIAEPETLAGPVVVLGHHLLEDGGSILLPEAGSAKGDGKGDAKDGRGRPGKEPR